MFLGLFALGATALEAAFAVFLVELCWHSISKCGTYRKRHSAGTVDQSVIAIKLDITISENSNDMFQLRLRQLVLDFNAQMTVRE